MCEGEREIERHTERSSAKAAPCEWPLRLSSSSTKSASRRRFAIAFSFIIGMSRPVRKSCNRRRMSSQNERGRRATRTRKQLAM